MKKIFMQLAVALIAIITATTANAQCDSVIINLTGRPDSVWVGGAIPRNNYCCGASGGTTCLKFVVTLDPNAAGITFDVAGAPAFGSLQWKLDCSAPKNLRDTVCVSGVGPHRITFCKSGSNDNGFIITSIPKPTFPKNLSIRLGCNLQINTYGTKPGTITWTSVEPGAVGAYNYILSSTTATNPVINPNLLPLPLPSFIKFRVCANPSSTKCVTQIQVCDTVKVNFYNALTGSVSGTPYFCNVGVNPGTMMTASGSGGDGNYTYSWYDQSSVLVGTGASFYATSQQTYNVIIKDGITSSSCQGYSIAVPISVTNQPVPNAGADQYICPNVNNGKANLSGSMQNASGYSWSGGAGTFNNIAIPNPIYTPTAGEISAGSVTLTLTSSGAGGGCTNQSDQVVINWPSALDINFSHTPTIKCVGDVTTISSTLTEIRPGGGLAPYTYSWNNGQTTTSIANVPPGTYQLTVKDAINCAYTKSYIVNPATPLTLSATNTVMDQEDGAPCEGEATATVGGGAGGYTYSWTSVPSQNTVTATALCYGVYSVYVSDANGCTKSASMVVNSPRCNGFMAGVANYPLNCNGDNNGTLTPVVFGGSGNYNYSWNDISAQTTSTATGLQAGAYLVTVIDVTNSCTTVASGVVSEPSKLVNVFAYSDATTVGGTNGSATANI